MAKGFYREVTKLLRQNGYSKKKNAKGSHEKWVHEETGMIMLVPYNMKSRHTANGILKDAGINEKL